jgi:hypothetical protein
MFAKILVPAKRHQTQKVLTHSNTAVMVYR